MQPNDVFCLSASSNACFIRSLLQDESVLQLGADSWVNVCYHLVVMILCKFLPY